MLRRDLLQTILAVTVLPYVSAAFGGKSLASTNVSEEQAGKDFIDQLVQKEFESIQSIAVAFRFEKGGFLNVEGENTLYLEKTGAGYDARVNVSNLGGKGFHASNTGNWILNKISLGLVDRDNLDVTLKSTLEYEDGKLLPTRIEQVDNENESKKGLAFGQQYIKDPEDKLSRHGRHGPLSCFFNYVLFDRTAEVKREFETISREGKHQMITITTKRHPQEAQGKQYEYVTDIEGSIAGLVDGPILLNLLHYKGVYMPTSAFVPRIDKIKNVCLSLLGGTVQ